MPKSPVATVIGPKNVNFKNLLLKTFLPINVPHSSNI